MDRSQLFQEFLSALLKGKDALSARLLCFCNLGE
jgi:hypothetical protein